MKKIKPRQRKPRKWTEEKVKFLKDNYKKLCYKDISDYLRLSYSVITHKASRLGLDSRDLWTKEEDGIIKDQYWCNPDVWDLLPNRSREAVTVQARKLGVQRRCGRYSINFKFFEEWNKDSAYVVGFLTADGCVEPHFNRISCELSMKDYKHLVNIRNLISSTNPICVKKTKYACSLAIHNKKMVSDIIEKGVLPRKTTRVRLPHMPNEVFKDFLRGYIDGDGSIYYNGNSIVLCILGNNDFIKDLKDKILSFYGLDSTISEHNKHLGTKNCYRIRYCGKKMKFMLDDIYYDDCFSLMRKQVLARGENPRKTHTTQISQSNVSDIGEPEGKTENFQIPQRLNVVPLY